MRMLQVCVAALVIVGLASSAHAEVTVTMHDGRVTIVARDATLRQILAEWARVGQTKIVNGDRVPGGPVTMELTDVPEQQALDLLLRNISGYLAAPRAVAATNLSRYDRILVMPTPAAPRQAAAVAAPVFQPALVTPAEPAANGNDENRPVTVVPAPQGPVFTTFQQPQVVGAPPAAPAPSPNAPAPASAPGFVPPAPAPASGDQPAMPNATAPTTGTGVVGAPRPGMVIQAPPATQPGQTQPGQ